MKATFSFRSFLRVVALAAACTVATLQLQSAAAQSYPSRPVRLVVPVPAGGLQDTLARALGHELSKLWGQPLIIENRVGGSGVIAAEFVARAQGDGHTIFMTDNVSLITNQYLRRSLPYDPVRDFTPVVSLARGGDVVVVSQDSPIKTMQDLIAQARARPGELNYGSFGLGSAAHLDTEAFREVTGVSITHIPYKGGAEIIKALLGGELHFSFTGLPPALPLIRQGRLRALAYGARERSPAMPDVPTLAEAGVPYFETGGTFGWLAPSATPKAVVDKIAADTAKVVTMPAFRDKFILGVGLDPLNLGPAQFADLLNEQRATLSKRFKSLNLKIE